MDKLRTLSKGTQITLGASVLLLIDSLFFNWYEVKGTSVGESMWHGIGFLAGIVLLAIIVWIGLRIAGVNVEVGISNSMITAGLAVLLLLLVLIRVLSKPGGGFAGNFIERTIWLWIGLLLAIAVVAGAWMSMQAAGESLSDVKAKVSSMTASAGGSSAGASTPAPPPAPEAPVAPSAPAPEAPAAPAPPPDEPSGGTS